MEAFEAQKWTLIMCHLLNTNVESHVQDLTEILVGLSWRYPRRRFYSNKLFSQLLHLFLRGFPISTKTVSYFVRRVLYWDQGKDGDVEVDERNETREGRKQLDSLKDLRDQGSREL